MGDQTVWKYRMDVGVRTQHEIPAGARFAAFAVHDFDYAGPVFEAWFIVDPTADVETRTFWIRATGEPFNGRYLGTVRHAPTMTVWHLTEEPTDG